MKAVRIRQIERLAKALRADGYEVTQRLRSETNTLLIVIKLKKGDDEDIKASSKVKGVE